ncbi:hypothetical protein [Robinsoniella peoriensis]|uniref:Uncharacterized protein n=1 Tax=Robinsoniella peoriensis TaxID=180332 RepID=A0A4U8PZJ2_9FIRM|nr:hypothetical protein DSM106044_05390 [Robinsoniella peoriensis]
MEKTRFETGMENLKRIDGIGGEAVIQSLSSISPDLGRYIVGITPEKNNRNLFTMYSLYRICQSIKCHSGCQKGIY